MGAEAISVLVTLYNHQNYIQEAIESALEQTLPPYEVIVIDDHSSDRSLEVVKRIKHPALRILAEPYNLGGQTTVKGVRNCRGDYVAILNSDDVWDSHKLERQMLHLRKHPGCGAVFTHSVLIDEHGGRWRDGSHHLQQVFQVKNRSRPEWLRYFFDNGNAFCASSAMIRAECFRRLGPLDGRYIQLQDFEMWVRIAASGYDLHIVPEPLTYYRVARKGTNLSSSTRPVRIRQTYEYALLLRNLWRIRGIAELMEVFPEEALLSRADDTLFKFCLAMIAGRRPSAHHRQFAVDCMFDAAGEQGCMALAAERFGFTHKAYREFMARNPIGLFAENSFMRSAAMFLATRAPPWLVQNATRAKRQLLGR
ncbi:MAG TPA: glycosyltransferase [Burkholderiales bacterium]|nr:glycosyltransferase [Burkholderiales bacterium]